MKRNKKNNIGRKRFAVLVAENLIATTGVAPHEKRFKKAMKRAANFLRGEGNGKVTYSRKDVKIGMYFYLNAK